MSRDVFDYSPEIAVLSLILKNPSSLDDNLIDDLKPHMFSSIPNQKLFETVLDIHRGGLIPEFGLIATTLSSKGILKICGGESYLNYLFNQDFDDSNFNEFVRHVIKSYKARELISITNHIPSMIVSNEGVDSTIAWVRSSLDSLSTTVGDGVITLKTASHSAYDVIKEKLLNPNKIATTTGFPILDGVTGGYWEGDSIIIAGRPSMGKSSFMCNSVLSGEPSLLFSLEMGKQTVVNRLIAIKSGVPVFKLRLGTLAQKELDTVYNTVKEIEDLPIYIDTTFAINLDYVVSTIRKYHKLYGVRVVHVDYIQLLVERSSTATQDIGRVSREFKLLANDLGITIVTYSQLNRLVEMRDDKRPMLSDLRQSGNLEEDADLVLFLYRDELYNRDTKNKGELEFIIRKHRNGSIGTVITKFEEVTNLIKEK